MSRPAELSPVDVLAAQQAGMTAREAADHLGFSHAYLCEIAHDMGVKFRDPRSPDDDLLARMVAMREAGATYRQIAAETGRCLSGVRKILIRATQESA